MKVIDAWQTDHGYLYGQSLLSGIVNSLPHDPKAGGFAITSNMVRTMWYPNVEGGALPTTAVGEMYMNFGPVGPFIGMFFVGFLIRLWYNFVIRSRNYWQYLIFLIISLVFIAIYPKVDFTNLGLFDPVVVFFPLIILWFLSSLIKVKVPDSALIKRQLK
jgi:MFS family permease